MHLLSATPAVAQPAEQGTAEKDLNLLAQALERFKTHHGRYPSAQEGLPALARLPSELPPPDRQPDSQNEPLLTDPWGRAYVYRFPGVRNPGTFDLYSLGADGLTRSAGWDADDINNWDRSRRWRRHYAGQTPAQERMQLILALVYAGAALAVWRVSRAIDRELYGEPERQEPGWIRKLITRRQSAGDS